jgi:drug/metabolite transporter (DMT)-like permease
MKSSHTDLEAVGFALTGFTCWVFADSIIKVVGNSKLPAYEVVAFLGIFVSAFLLLHGCWRHEVRALWPHSPARQLLRSCLDLINNLCVVVALRHLPLTMFYILVFMAPMVTTILSAVFLRERMEWRKGLAVVTGFAGVVIAVNPFSSASHADWVGFASCLVCVACFSTSMVWSRVLTRTERPESLAFFSGLVMTVCGCGGMCWHAVPLSARFTMALGAMGIFCALGNVCFFIALKHTSAATVSQYHYTQLLTGALIAYLVWHEMPTIWMLMGGILIVASGLYIALRASRVRLDPSSLFPVLPEE